MFLEVSVPFLQTPIVPALAATVLFYHSFGDATPVVLKGKVR